MPRTCCGRSSDDTSDRARLAGRGADEADQGAPPRTGLRYSFGRRHTLLIQDSAGSGSDRGEGTHQPGQFPSRSRAGKGGVPQAHRSMPRTRHGNKDRPQPRLSGRIHHQSVRQHPARDGYGGNGMGEDVQGGGFLQRGRFPEGEQYCSYDRSIQGTCGNDAGRGCGFPSASWSDRIRERRQRAHQVLRRYRDPAPGGHRRHDKGVTHRAACGRTSDSTLSRRARRARRRQFGAYAGCGNQMGTEAAEKGD